MHTRYPKSKTKILRIKMLLLKPRVQVRTIRSNSMTKLSSRQPEKMPTKEDHHSTKEEEGEEVAEPMMEKVLLHTVVEVDHTVEVAEEDTLEKIIILRMLSI